MSYLQIFRIQDPESSGSKDPAGKSNQRRPVGQVDRLGRLVGRVGMRGRYVR